MIHFAFHTILNLLVSFIFCLPFFFFHVLQSSVERTDSNGTDEIIAKIEKTTTEKSAKLGTKKKSRKSRKSADSEKENCSVVNGKWEIHFIFCNIVHCVLHSRSKCSWNWKKHVNACDVCVQCVSVCCNAISFFHYWLLNTETTHHHHSFHFHP